MKSDIELAADALAKSMSGVKSAPIESGYSAKQISQTDGQQFMSAWNKQRESDK